MILTKRICMKIDALCFRDFKQHKNLLFFHFSDTFMSQWKLNKGRDDDNGNENVLRIEKEKLFICNNEINNGGNEFGLSTTLFKPRSKLFCLSFFLCENFVWFLVSFKLLNVWKILKVHNYFKKILHVQFCCKTQPKWCKTSKKRIWIIKVHPKSNILLFKMFSCFIRQLIWIDVTVSASFLFREIFWVFIKIRKYTSEKISSTCCSVGEFV